MCEVEIQVEFSGDRFVLRKLFAVVGGHRVRGLGDGQEHLENSLRDAVGSAPFHLAEQRQSRFAFGERDAPLRVSRSVIAWRWPFPTMVYTSQSPSRSSR